MRVRECQDESGADYRNNFPASEAYIRGVCSDAVRLNEAMFEVEGCLPALPLVDLIDFLRNK